MDVCYGTKMSLENQLSKQRDMGQTHFSQTVLDLEELKRAVDLLY